MAQVLTSEGLSDFYAGKPLEEMKPDRVLAKEAKLSKDDKPAKDAITEPVVASTEAKKVDETEDENGLTAAERLAYTESITRKLSAKHRALKQAEANEAKQGREKQAAVKEASELRAEIAKLKEAVPADDGKGPKRADFASDADWWDAKIDWKAEQKAEEKFTKLEKQREQAKADAAKHERIAAFATTVDDYDEVVDSLKGVSQHQGVIDYASESEMGPQIIYYLGQHPDEYEKIARMKPVFALAEIGKIETKLERKAVKAEEKAEKADTALDSFKAPISKAPAPITQLGESTAVIQTDPSKMDFEQLRVYNRNQRLLQAQRGGR